MASFPIQNYDFMEKVGHHQYFQQNLQTGHLSIRQSKL